MGSIGHVGVLWVCRDDTPHGILTNKKFVPPLQMWVEEGWVDVLVEEKGEVGSIVY